MPSSGMHAYFREPREAHDLIRPCHILDTSAGWAERVALRSLAARAVANSGPLLLAGPPQACAMLSRALDSAPQTMELHCRATLLARDELRRALRTAPANLVHAWSLRAAAIASGAGDRPLVVEAHDPAIRPADVKYLRTISRPAHFAIACGSGIVRRRLIEGGLSPELCVVVRPGVDFAFINRIKRSHLRRSLGIAADETVILLPRAEGPGQNLVDGLLACFMFGLLEGSTRILLSGATREADRLARYASTLPYNSGDRVICTGEDVPFEELLCVADVHLLAARSDFDVRSIAWAMATRAAVIAPAVPAVAEMIAHRLNGLLFNPARGRSLVVPLVALLRDRAAQLKAKEEAHGQAFEVFSARRCAEQYARLHENVTRGVSPAEGIDDAARAA